MTNRRSTKTGASERNDALVLQALETSKIALSAFDLIENLQEHGLSSPPTVYRSLARLIGKGLVHRVESLNAFIACRSHSHDKSTETLFAICIKCGRVQEIDDKGLGERVQELARSSTFLISQKTLEVRGFCVDCLPDAESEASPP